MDSSLVIPSAFRLPTYFSSTLDACRFEHPQTQNRGPSQQPTGNRFGPLANQSNQTTNNRDYNKYPGLTAETIQRDLTLELPSWILSSYCPARDAPGQLFGGPEREQSPEEIRLYFMMGQMAGNPQGALNDIQRMYQNAQQAIQTTLNNTNAAIRFIQDAEKEHPNRIDICKQGTASNYGPSPFTKPPMSSAFSNATPQSAFQNTPAPVNPFGAPAAPSGAGFGQPASLGPKPSPFSMPAPALQQPQTSAFGQPAALGTTQSPFGAPAQPSTGFGQTSALGARPNPFGAPALGQTAQASTPFGQPKPAFGQPSQPSGGPAFGQPSLGAPFGGASQPGGAFGQTAALGAKPNPFGAQPAANPFGQPAASKPNPFGQAATTTASSANPPANPFGQPAAAPANPFGQPAAPAPAANPFGQPQQQQPPPAANPFGAPAPAATSAPANPFGQPAATTSPFGAVSASNSAANPFGQPAAAFPPTNASAPIGTQDQGPYAPGATRQHPDISQYSSKDMNGALRMFKGKPVEYEKPKSKGGKPIPIIRNFDGTFMRIWMPDGAPKYTKETEAEDPAVYEEPTVKEQWRVFVETGSFAEGIMPEVPPKREYCAWDF